MIDVKKNISYNQLQYEVNKLSKISGNIYSNYTYDETYYNIFPETYFLQHESTLILVVHNNKYNLIFYWTLSYDNLISIINNIKDKFSVPSIIECLYSKNSHIKNRLIEENEFIYYGGILRLNKQVEHHDTNFDDNINIEYATQDDINNIQTLYSSIFNLYIDRILTKSELEYYINHKNILVNRHGSHIAGCLIFSKLDTETTYHLRYWFVDKKHHEELKGVGKSLLHKLYKIVDTGNMIEVWSRKDNQLVTDIYEKYGFKKDGLECDVLIYSKDKNLIEPLIPLN